MRPRRTPFDPSTRSLLHRAQNTLKRQVCATAELTLSKKGGAGGGGGGRTSLAASVFQWSLLLYGSTSSPDSSSSSVRPARYLAHHSVKVMAAVASSNVVVAPSLSLQRVPLLVEHAQPCRKTALPSFSFRDPWRRLAGRGSVCDIPTAGGQAATSSLCRRKS